MEKIVFFGGKGGVGKTSCASSYAVSKANNGNKVLLISTDPAHSTADIFQQKIGSKIVKIRENLDGLEIDAQKESDTYLKNIKGNLTNVVSPVIVDEINRQLDAASVSPGTHEAALFDKMIEIINESSKDYDYIVFDTAPTGHTIRLLTLPELLGSWIGTLLKKRRKALRYREMARGDKPSDLNNDPIVKILSKRMENMERARKIMIDQKALSFIFVLNAERLPIEETKKAVSALEKYDIPIPALVVNRIMPENPTDDFWKKKKIQEKNYLKDIEKAFGGKTLIKIPLLSEDMNKTTVDEISQFFTHT